MHGILQNSFRVVYFCREAFIFSRCCSAEEDGCVMIRSSIAAAQFVVAACENRPFLRTARWARYNRARALAGRASWQGDRFAPRCIPPTRSVAPWTSPDALRLLDFRPERFHQPLDPRPLEDFALPPDPHRPGVCRRGSAQGVCRLDLHEGPCPCDPRKERPALASLANRQPAGCALNSPVRWHSACHDSGGRPER